MNPNAIRECSRHYFPPLTQQLLIQHHTLMCLSPSSSLSAALLCCLWIAYLHFSVEGSILLDSPTADKKITVALDLQTLDLHLILSHSSPDSLSNHGASDEKMESFCHDVIKVYSQLQSSSGTAKATEMSLLVSLSTGSIDTLSTYIFSRYLHEEISGLISKCASQAALFPPLSLDLTRENHENNMEHKLYWILPLNKQHNNDNQDSNKLNSKPWHHLLQVMSSSSLLSSHYIQQSFRQDNLSLEWKSSAVWKWAISPFHLHHQDEDSLFYAQVNSSLLGEGMHRTHQHDVVLSFPKRTTTPAEGNFYNGFITLFYLLPPEIFIDLDDPSPKDSNLGCRILTPETSAPCQIEIFTPKKRVLNIEQPSFASPLYIMALNITFHATTFNENLNPSEGLTIHLQFLTTIHLRYQNPLQHGYYHSIDIPSPMVYQGRSLDSVDNNKYTLTPQQQQSSSKITIEVQTASLHEYEFVMILTGVASALGAIVSMKYINAVRF